MTLNVSGTWHSLTLRGSIYIEIMPLILAAMTEFRVVRYRSTRLLSIELLDVDRGEVVDDTVRHRRLEVTPGDIVELQDADPGITRESISDILDFLDGKSDWFAPFDTPRYHGEQGWVQSDENTWENRGYNGGPDETRLIAFAHLVRPFRWTDDPRLPQMRDQVTRLQLGHGESDLTSTPTQDLWDALFMHVRGDRFMDGLVASYSYGLVRIANEIRRRLLASRS